MVRQLILTWAGLLSLTTGPAIAAADSVPRYRFAPGQELTYRMDWTIRYTAADRTALHDTYTDAVARVVRENPDGSFRIVVSWRETNTKTAAGGLTVTGPWSSVFFVDVFPDGRELPIQDRANGAIAGMLFPPFPRNEQELKSGWTAKLQDFTYVCTAEPEKHGYEFRATVDAPVMRQLHDSRTSHFSFDDARGVVSRSDDTFVRDSKTNAAGAGSTRLVSVKSIGDTELKQLAKDTQTYTDALDAYNAGMKHAENVDLQRARQTARDAESQFRAAVEKIADSDLKAEGERILARHTERLEGVVATISRRATRH